MSFFDALKQVCKTVGGFSVLRMWGWFGGRTFVFVLLCLGLTYDLSRRGLLTAKWGAVIGTLAGLFTARAVADDVVNAPASATTTPTPVGPENGPRHPD